MELGDQKIKETRAVRLVEAAPPPFASKIMSIHHLLFMCVFFFPLSFDIQHDLSRDPDETGVHPTKPEGTHQSR